MFSGLLRRRLREPRLERALKVRLDFILFCGLDLHGSVPDETTHCRFRNALTRAGIFDDLLAEVCRQIEGAKAQRVLAPATIAETLQPADLETPLPGRTMLRHDETPLRPAPHPLFRARQGACPDGHGRHRAEPAQGRKQDQTLPPSPGNRIAHPPNPFARSNASGPARMENHKTGLQADHHAEVLDQVLVLSTNPERFRPPQHHA